MFESSGFLLFLFLDGLILIALVAIVGGLLHYRRERLLTHAERMKALELGRDWPEDPATARLKVALGSTAEDREEPEKSIAVQTYTITGWTSGCGLMFAFLCSPSPERLRHRRGGRGDRRDRDDLRDDPRGEGTRVEAGSRSVLSGLQAEARPRRRLKESGAGSHFFTRVRARTGYHGLG